MVNKKKHNKKYLSNLDNKYKKGIITRITSRISFTRHHNLTPKSKHNKNTKKNILLLLVSYSE